MQRRVHAGMLNRYSAFLPAKRSGLLVVSGVATTAASGAGSCDHHYRSDKRKYGGVQLGPHVTLRRRCERSKTDERRLAASASPETPSALTLRDELATGCIFIANEPAEAETPWRSGKHAYSGA